MAKVFLIRHAASVANDQGLVCGRLDLGLSPTGMAQLGRLQRYSSAFLPHSFRLLSSPLTRARQTAEAIANGNEIVLDAELTEMDTGEHSQLTYTELYRKYPEFMSIAQGDLRFPGGESLQDVFNRAQRFLARTDLRSPDYVIVSHSGLLNALLHTLFGIPIQTFPAFVIDNGHAVEIFWDGEVQIWKMLRQNFRIDQEGI